MSMKSTFLPAATVVVQSMFIAGTVDAQTTYVMKGIQPDDPKQVKEWKAKIDKYTHAATHTPAETADYTKALGDYKTFLEDKLNTASPKKPLDKKVQEYKDQYLSIVALSNQANNVLPAADPKEVQDMQAKIAKGMDQAKKSPADLADYTKALNGYRDYLAAQGGADADQRIAALGVKPADVLEEQRLLAVKQKYDRNAELIKVEGWRTDIAKLGPIKRAPLQDDTFKAAISAYDSWLQKEKSAATGTHADMVKAESKRMDGFITRGTNNALADQQMLIKVSQVIMQGQLNPDRTAEETQQYIKDLKELKTWLEEKTSPAEKARVKVLGMSDEGKKAAQLMGGYEVNLKLVNNLLAKEGVSTAPAPSKPKAPGM